MKKKDFFIIGAALFIALVFFGLFKTGVLSQPKLPVGPQDGQGITLTLAPVDGGESVQVPLADHPGAPQQADSYLLVTVGRRVYAPVPLANDSTLSIDQDGGQQNVARISPGQVYMQSATCNNQVCVHQGAVSLSNRDLRALYNQIICTPNQVVLEVLSPSEAARYFKEAP